MTYNDADQMLRELFQDPVFVSQVIDSLGDDYQKLTKAASEVKETARSHSPHDSHESSTQKVSSPLVLSAQTVSSVALAK